MRKRMLSPGFFRNPGLSELSPYHALLFEGLWVLADREGRLRDHPGLIKADLFPLRDEVTPKKVDEWLFDLAEHRERFIVRYSIEGQDYIEVRNFKRHRMPSVREKASEIPSPDAEGAVMRHRQGSAKALSEHCQGSDKAVPEHCQGSDGATEDLVADHVVSRRNGGSHHPDNLQALCQRCNARKAALVDAHGGVP